MNKILLFMLLICLSSCSKQIITSQLNASPTYEVTATLLPNEDIICAWMEKKEGFPSTSIPDHTQIAYKFSEDHGKTWTEKKIAKKSQQKDAYIAGNPYLHTTKTGSTFLVTMNVKGDFFSSDLVLHHWNEEHLRFDELSIINSSDSTLLDKPAFTSLKEKLFVTYVEYSKTLEKGKIMMQHSIDEGKTWSAPKVLFDDEVIYLGTSLKSDDDNLYFSVGSFWNKKIFFSKSSEAISLAQEKQQIATISDDLQSAMTEMAIDGEQIAVGWLYNHKPNELYLSRSRDEGESWTEPFLLSRSGNLLSIDFNSKGNVLCLFSEFDDDKYSVFVKEISTNNKIVHTTILKDVTTFEDSNEYIGAFQKILYQEKRKKNLAFWIDYSDSSKLYFSKWRSNMR